MGSLFLCFFTFALLGNCPLRWFHWKLRMPTSAWLWPGRGLGLIFLGLLGLRFFRILFPRCLSKKSFLESHLVLVDGLRGRHMCFLSGSFFSVLFFRLTVGGGTFVGLYSTLRCVRFFRSCGTFGREGWDTRLCRSCL
jgi:hypothetical protein